MAAYSAEMSDQEMFTGLDGLMLAEAFSLGRVDKRLQPQASGGEIEEALEG
jgi:hypothetical protein